MSGSLGNLLYRTFAAARGTLACSGGAADGGDWVPSTARLPTHASVASKASAVRQYASLQALALRKCLKKFEKVHKNGEGASFMSAVRENVTGYTAVLNSPMLVEIAALESDMRARGKLPATGGLPWPPAKAGKAVVGAGAAGGAGGKPAQMLSPLPPQQQQQQQQQQGGGGGTSAACLRASTARGAVGPASCPCDDDAGCSCPGEDGEGDGDGEGSMSCGEGATARSHPVGTSASPSASPSVWRPLLADLQSGGLSPDDLTCSVCLDVLHRPVAIRCSHRFCLGCARAICFAEGGGHLKVGSRVAKCPLCRRPGAFSRGWVLHWLDLFIHHQHPVQWKAREKERVATEAANKAAAQQQQPVEVVLVGQQVFVVSQQ